MWHSLLISCFILFTISLVDSTGLYENSDRITVLDANNFSDKIGLKPTVVQFYSHSCGACVNYSPHFKNISFAVRSWKWAVQLAVVDCADIINRDLCSQYTDSYPKFVVFLQGNRYDEMPKYYHPQEFRKGLSQILVNSNQLSQLTAGKTARNALILDGPSADSVAMIILDFQGFMKQPLRIGDTTSPSFSLLDHSGEAIIENSSEDNVRDYLTVFYDLHGKVDAPLDMPKEDPSQIAKMSALPPPVVPVYAADIVASLRRLLVQDVSLKSVIKGEELEALKEFLTVVSKYLPLSANYLADLENLKKAVGGMPQVTQSQWRNMLSNSEFVKGDVKHVACRGSKPHFRGYPCGLWVMFHAMTVNRFLLEGTSTSGSSIAHALNRFVPRFFSCSYCAFHFAKMTSNVRLPGESAYPNRPGETPPFPLVIPEPSELPVAPHNPREEILWLATAHNVVNKRLSGEASDDPTAPKSIFPSPVQCPKCYSDEAEMKWTANKFSATPDRQEELLAFLVHHYKPSSWRWEGMSVSYQDLSGIKSNFYQGEVFSTGDLVLVGVVSVCCTAAIAGLLAIILCRRKRVRMSGNHQQLATSA